MATVDNNLKTPTWTSDTIGKYDAKGCSHRISASSEGCRRRAPGLPGESRGEEWLWQQSMANETKGVRGRTREKQGERQIEREKEKEREGGSKEREIDNAGVEISRRKYFSATGESLP